MLNYAVVHWVHHWLVSGRICESAYKGAIMKCSWCGKDNAVYIKDDCPVVSRYNQFNKWKETRLLCHECALRWCYDYSFIYKRCEHCGNEEYIERMIKDCNGHLFCSTACMLAHWNFKPIGEQNNV